MAEDALSRVFARAGPPFTLRGGDVLARPGQAVDALYRLEAGRIAELRPAAEGGSSLVATHRPGAIFGGVEALGDGVHHTELVAVRDSELRALPISRAARLLRRDPHILSEVARAALRRLTVQEAAPRRVPGILGLVGLAGAPDVRVLAEDVAERLRRLGKTVAVVGAEAADDGPARLSRLEETHDLVITAARPLEGAFIAFSIRQIDRLALVAPGSAGPDQIPASLGALRGHRLLDILRLHGPGPRQDGAEAWLEAAPQARLVNLQRDRPADLDRLARLWAGRSVGLVLSGGGARAYAHMGVIKALRELEVPIDVLAGTSMGAIVAAGLAMGWSWEELDDRLRDAFVASSPLGDMAFPILAMTHGKEVEARLERHFGEACIGDLALPFACVSTDLTAGGAYVHRRGLLRRALRCSLSLPGVLPPMIENGHVLVDGALVANLPADLVRAAHDGPTIGVDVAQGSGLTPEDLAIEGPGWSWVASGAWRRGPPIVSILMRAATVGSDAAAAAERTALDLYIAPDVQSVELRDWKAYDAAVDAGYRAALAVADQLARMAA